MDVQVITDPDEIREIVPVIKSAWGMQDLGQLVKDVVASMRFHGGLVLLAKERGKTLGMHFSFPGYRHGQPYLYSHMTGVISESKYGGVGKTLKLAQKEWAKEHGYKLIAWTYDPLMTLNANFNFNKLGVFSRTYLRNFYGEMEDSLNFGMPTDRFVAEWWIDYNKPSMKEPETFANESNNIGEIEINTQSTTIGLHISPDFVALKKNDSLEATKIRMATREAMETLFQNGYAAVDFNREESYYTFSKENEYVKKLGRNIFLD
jgi:chorismate synthase